MKKSSSIYRFAGYACLLLMLGACGKSHTDNDSDAAQAQEASETAGDQNAAPANGEPVLLHAHVIYSAEHSIGEPGVPPAGFKSQLTFAVDFSEKATRQRIEGHYDYELAQDAGAQSHETIHGVQGSVDASGKSTMKSSGTKAWSLGTFEKQLLLGDAEVAKRLKCSIDKPTVVDADKQLRISVVCAALMTGEQLLVGASDDGEAFHSLDGDPSTVPLNCDGPVDGFSDPPPYASVCKFSLLLEPKPIAPPAPGVSEAQSAMISAAVGVFNGATTQYRTGGHFVVQLANSYSMPTPQTTTVITVDATVWSTGPNDTWTPPNLKPLPPLPPPKPQI